jgi:hypothetical protein
MQDFRQRVAEVEFCPDAQGASNQIQMECCRRAAHLRRKVPNWNKLTHCLWYRDHLKQPFAVDRGKRRRLQSQERDQQKWGAVLRPIALETLKSA